MATYTVSSSNNSGNGSLREAVSLANSNPGLDDVYLQTDVDLVGSVKITDSINIGTPYGATITQKGEGTIFDIDDDDSDSDFKVTLYRLSLTKGNSDSPGGAIYSVEDLNIVDSQIYDNSSSLGGGIYQQGGYLSIQRSQIENNRIISSQTKEDETFGEEVYLENADFELNLSTIAGNVAVVDSEGTIASTALSQDIVKKISAANVLVDVFNSDNKKINKTSVEFYAEPILITEKLLLANSDDTIGSLSFKKLPKEDGLAIEAIIDMNLSNVRENKNILNVDDDFAGKLNEAIASAVDGDTIVLGDRVYDSNGITVDKNIEIKGIKGGSIIDGAGTEQAIIRLNEGASGATISGIEITNGNIGIDVNGANNVDLSELEIHNIGIDKTIRESQNNIGIQLTNADEFYLGNSDIYNIGRKGVGIIDTDGGVVEGLTIEDINLKAEHAQSYDAGGIKLFNTNNVTVADNKLNNINAFHIWNDITSGTKILGNEINGVGDSFKAPEFNHYVDVAGIYNEKSYDSTVTDNIVTSTDDFPAFRATEFTTESMNIENNNFDSVELNSPDYWANESAEKHTAITLDPNEANFGDFEADFFADANIGV